MKVRLTSTVPSFEKELLDVAGIFVDSLSLAEPGEPADLDVRITDRLSDGSRQCLAVISGGFAAEHRSEGLPGTDPQTEKRLRKRQQKLALYHAFVQATGRRPPWGSLTGIRPTRLVYEAMAEGHTLGDAAAWTRETFDLRGDKAELLEDVIRAQTALPEAEEGQIACYIGIPFCPSRCRYCSFLSREAGDGAALPAYVDALTREIGETARLMREHGLQARSVYVGGGTPTVLPPALLERVMSAAEPMIMTAREVTVEAGRPDSITRDKLRVIREGGGTRLSVNPQTFFDGTLAAIGRRHTARQAEEAFSLAREEGFMNVNMDLIAGLPGETGDMFGRTLTRAFRLRPESLTVHTLSVKRSSLMHREGDALSEGGTVEAMVDEARRRARDEGYAPYYLYRQKHMAGNLENVGYALDGFACLYNVDMMEDKLTVLAMGAGSVSKRVWPGRQKILRAPNAKDVFQYMRRVDEMVQRKDALMRGVGKGVRPASAAGDEADVLPLETQHQAGPLVDQP